MINARIFISLALAQILAVSCNLFLDIQYGSFGFETALWSGIIISSLLLGYWLNKKPIEHARTWLKIGAVITILASLIIFFPVWGLPRASAYMLSALMCTYNFTLRTRREVGFSLLITLVLIIFAVTHYRAEWTMLFYLLPYVACAIFTTISLQAYQVVAISNELSLSKPSKQGQLWAISIASLLILTLGLALYLFTPQLTEPYFYSHWGNPASLSLFGEHGNGSSSGSQNGKSQANGSSTQANSASGGDQQGSSSGDDQMRTDAAGYKNGLDRIRDLFTHSQEIRTMADTVGMPQWQQTSLRKLADISDTVGSMLEPIKKSVKKMGSKIKDFISANKAALFNLLLILLLLLLLFGLFWLFREARVGLWLATRYDYWRIKSNPNRSPSLYYKALLRLFALNEFEKSNRDNTTEFLHKIGRDYPATYTDSKKITRAYEDYRFGTVQAYNNANPLVLSQAYRAAFTHLAKD